MDNNDSQWSYTGSLEGTSNTENAVEAISWEASEYVAHEKSMSWYVALYGGSLFITLVVYVLNRDIITSIAIMTVAFCAGFFASRQPGSKKYSLTDKGIEVDGRLFRYAEFRSFSLVEEGAIDSIWLKPLGRYKPALVMHFAPEDEQKIIDVLSNFLPFEQRELDAIDRASRRLRF